MKEKIGFYSSLLFTGLFAFLLVDTVRGLTGVFHQIPGSHKEALLIGFLLWFLLLLTSRDRDDDWAGQL